MIDLSQWRASIGLFNCINREYTSSTSGILLNAVVVTVFEYAVLHMFVYVITVLLILLCGDIETHPGPVYILCTSCNNQVNIRKKVCECGYVIHKKRGRKTGTNRSNGFNVSSGRPTIANTNIELDVPIGRPCSNANVKLDVPIGHPSGTTSDSGFDVSAGRPVNNTTTADADTQHW